MKLAFCLFKYFPFGGLQRDFLRIAKESVKRGHEVHVYTMHWEGEVPSELSVTIIPVTARQNHARSQEFVKNLSLENYDLVVGFNKMPGLDVYYAADTCYQAKAQQRGAWYRLTPRYRHLINYEKAVFAATEKTKILLISPVQQFDFQHFYHTSSERFHLLLPGIAKDRVAPANADDIRKECRREFSIAENDFLLLMVGSGFKTKGLDRTLKALAALPLSLRKRCHLFIIGQDNAAPFLQQAEKLGINAQVKFLGGRHDVTRFLLAADLLLHPAYNENTGTVLLEALVAGLPVIATDICGYAHYVQQSQAGVVLPSPFCQEYFDKTLSETLAAMPHSTWQENALIFAKTADIYSMPERAVDVIEGLQK